MSTHWMSSMALTLGMSAVSKSIEQKNHLIICSRTHLQQVATFGAWIQQPRTVNSNHQRRHIIWYMTMILSAERKDVCRRICIFICRIRICICIWRIVKIYLFCSTSITVKQQIYHLDSLVIVIGNIFSRVVTSKPPLVNWSPKSTGPPFNWLPIKLVSPVGWSPLPTEIAATYTKHYSRVVTSKPPVVNWSPIQLVSPVSWSLLVNWSPIQLIPNSTGLPSRLVPSPYQRFAATYTKHYSRVVTSKFTPPGDNKFFTWMNIFFEWIICFFCWMNIIFQHTIEWI